MMHVAPSPAGGPQSGINGRLRFPATPARRTGAGIIIAVLAGLLLLVTFIAGIFTKAASTGSLFLGFMLWAGIAIPLRGAVRDCTQCTTRGCVSRKLRISTAGPQGEAYIVHRSGKTGDNLGLPPSEPVMRRSGPLLHRFLRTGLRNDGSFGAPAWHSFAVTEASVWSDGTLRWGEQRLQLPQYWVRRTNRMGSPLWLMLLWASMHAALLGVAHYYLLQVSVVGDGAAAGERGPTDYLR